MKTRENKKVLTGENVREQKCGKSKERESVRRSCQRRSDWGKQRSYSMNSAAVEQTTATAQGDTRNLSIIKAALGNFVIKLGNLLI